MKWFRNIFLVCFCLFLTADFLTIRKYYRGRHTIHKVNIYDACAGPFCFLITNLNSRSVAHGATVSIYELRGGLTGIKYTTWGV